MAGNTFDAGTVHAEARLDRDEFQRDLKAIRAELQKFEKQQWKVPIQADLDNGKAQKDLEAFTRKPRTLKVDLVLNTAQAKRDYAQFKSTLTNTRANLTLNTAQAKRDYAQFKTTLTGTRADLGLNTAPAKREYAAFKATLKDSAAKVPVELDAGKAKREWQAFKAETSRTQTARVRVEANVQTALAKLLLVSAAMRQLNTMRTILHINVNATGAISAIARITSMIMALGGLAGIVGGLAGAIGGIGAAAMIAAGGLAPVLLAFAGVGKALKAMGDAQKNAGKEAAQAAKQQQSAAYQVESAHSSLRNAVVSAAKARRDAVRSVQSAEQQAARAIESALQQQGSAQRQLVSAQREARRAQQELTRAWEEGKRALQDLQDQLDMSMLDMEQAQFDLADAQKALNEARKKGNADEIARADLAYRRQVETIDQLSKRTNRLHEDNSKGQRAGIAGTQQYQGALENVRSTQESLADAERAAGQASRDVERARQDGIKAVAEAREQAQERIASADQQVLEAQRALTQAMRAFEDAGTSSANKVAEAFADLSPAAADFARYLFSLKPLLDQLSATAATNFFPPLREGMDTLLTRMPEIDRVIGQLAAGMGNGLKLVLTQLANPWWTGFFTMIGDAAGTIIPMMFQSIMNLAGALAVLITALMPIVPASLGILDALSAWIGELAGPLVQALYGMFPAVHAFIEALGFLGPLLVALSPILNILGVALSQILGAALQALIPILTALQPLFHTLATSISEGLVAALAWVTPYLVQFSQWASENPGKIAAIAAAVAGLALAFQGLIWISKVLGALGPLVAAFKPLLAMMGGMSGITSALGTAMRFLLGPIGLLIGALVLAYTTSAPFRDAINNLLGVIMQLVGALATAVMPIFTALAGVLTMVAGVFGQLVQQLAVALVPVINLVAGVLTQLMAAILPPLMTIINALVPIIGMLAGVFLQLVTAVVGPLIGALTQLIGAVLPPLVMLLQNVIMPVIGFLAQLFAGVLAFVITNVLIPALTFLLGILGGLVGFLADVLAWTITNLVVPALNFLVPIFQAIGDAAMWLWQNAILPAAEGLGIAFSAIGTAAMWLWENAIKPAFDFIGTAARVLFAVIMTVLITPLLIAWNLLSAAAMWLWENGIKPAFQAIGDFIAWVWTNVIRPALDAMVWLWQNVVAPAAMWLYNNVILPMFTAIGDIIKFVWEWIIKPALDALVWFWQNVLAPAARWLYETIIKPMWEGIGNIIKWVWENVIKPAFDAVSNGLNWLGQRFEDATNWIRDIWNRIKGYLAKPINFMIDTVWNKGVVPAWNAVAGLVGLGPIQPLGLIPEFASGGIYEPHRYTPGRDIGLAAVGGGEAIMRPEWTRAVGGSEYVNAANAAARSGGVSGVKQFINTTTSSNPQAEGRAKQSLMRRYPLDDLVSTNRNAYWLGKYAYGGVAPHVAAAGDEITRVLGRMPGGIGGVGGRGNVSDHPSGHALDFMTMSNQPLGDRVAAHLEQNAERMAVKYLIWKQRINQGKGWSGMENRGSVTANHFDHVHASFEGGPLGGAWGQGGGGGGVGNWILDKMRKVFDDLTNPPIEALGGLIGAPPPEWRRVPVSLAYKMRDTVRDFIFGKAEAEGGAMGATSNEAPGIVKIISDVARGRFGGMAHKAAVTGTATGLVESGLRNLAGGDRDSVGVFQQRPSMGWGTVEQIMNVTYAAGKFFSKFPGNWASWDQGKLAQHVQRSAFPAKYGQRMGEATALVNQHGGFDQGGELLRGSTLVRNLMPHSETVVPLPPLLVDNLLKLGQQQAFAPIVIDSGRVGSNVADQSGDGDSLVELARAIATEVRDQAPLVGSINVPVEDTTTARDAADEVVFKLRSVKRGGVHNSGRTR